MSDLDGMSDDMLLEALFAAMGPEATSQYREMVALLPEAGRAAAGPAIAGLMRTVGKIIADEQAKSVSAARASIVAYLTRVAEQRNADNATEKREHRYDQDRAEMRDHMSAALTEAAADIEAKKDLGL